MTDRGCEPSVDVRTRVRLTGEADAGLLPRLRDVLSGVPLETELVVDVKGGRYRDGQLWRLLAGVWDARRRAGGRCRVSGLHGGVLPDLETADLVDVFTLYRAVLAQS